MRLIHLLPLFPLLLATACPAQLQTRDQQLEKRIESLEARVKALEAKQAASPIADTSTISPGSHSRVPATHAGNLILDRWSHDFVPGEFGNHLYRLGIRIKNGYDKQIKLIDGHCIYWDALGEVVYSATLQKDVVMKPGAIKEIGGDYPINQFIANQKRMKDMRREDLTATLHIRKIVFEDNTILDLSK